MYAVYMSKLTDYEIYHLHDHLHKTILESINCLLVTDFHPVRVLFGGIVTQWLIPTDLKIKYIDVQIIETSDDN